MLKFENVSKIFGNVDALKDVSFEVEEGDFVFLTGPSGAGKTTVLRLILKELEPTSGKILVNSKNLKDIKSKNLPAYRQRIGVIYQDYKLIQDKTVGENIEVALAITGLPQKEWEPRVTHVLSLVGLKHREATFPAQLSGGELQRVALARALVVNPLLILADEPTGNLDWDTSLKIMELFMKINEEGKTILMATHHKQLMSEYKKRVIKLDSGTVVNEKVKANKADKEPVKDIEQTETKE